MGILLVILLALLAIPVQALDIQPPEAPDRVSGLMPREAESFTEGVWHLCKAALSRAEGPWKEAMGVCLGAVCAVLLCSLVGEVSPETAGKAGHLACCCAVAALLLRRSDTL
jgi:peptidoglycan/LPS O-acetylase OafA/YrhL